LAQFPVHIAAGIYGSDFFKKPRPLIHGLVIGSIAPDLDFIPMVAVYAFNPVMARSFHRSASHSLFIPILILVISEAVFLITSDQRISNWGRGLAIGLTSHIVLDLLFWFDQVKIMWPLDIWGISTTVNLWGGYAPPKLIHLLVGPAAEFLFYGLLYHLFRKRSLGSQNVERHIGRLRFLEGLSYFVFLAYVVLIFFLDRSAYEEAVYGLTTFLFAPLSLYWLWKLKKALINHRPDQMSQIIRSS
jgi:hypothetical protein